MPVFRFGVFEIDSDSGEVRKRGLRLRLREQPLRLLLALAGHPGRIVTREQLRHELWPDGTFVDFDRAINKAVSELRGVLGDSARTPRFVETLSKRGYRLLGPVEQLRSSPGAEPSGDHGSDVRLACVTGRYLWNRRTIADLQASIGYFDRALAIDPDCAPAHAGHADVHLLLGIWGLRPADAAFGAARSAAERALSRDPNLVEAHTSLAEVFTGYEWDWPQAELRYRHALSLRPDYATAHQFYAQMLVCLGRYAEAAFHIEQARRADPVSPAINSFLPYIHLAGRQYDRALEEARHAVDLEPRAPLALWTLGRASLFSGRTEDAVAALERALPLAGRASMWTAALSFARARAGDRSGAEALQCELVERGRAEHVPSYDLAVTFAGLGQRGAALEELERAFTQREMRIVNLGDPEFDVLHDDRRYRQLAERLHLPGALTAFANRRAGQGPGRLAIPRTCTRQRRSPGRSALARTIPDSRRT
jgi:DNA-binding winged helix-turn-helix (wHTH) protein/tetratricopeptide (TPR) repeat protein